MSPAANENKAKITTPTDREIRTERIFNAPRERVWKAWTDAQALAAAFNMEGAFNDASFALMRGASEPEAIAAIVGAACGALPDPEVLPSRVR